ncbi:aminopeptidase N-like [Pseudomyrmex gracilis]|uniref:aminopeptidase N-like n=1 Tax=Pseudomyrmex gracilis TaxID=219809 RepID=UPI00099569BC|nr:aminopeptidase N-like [Pseudomyrmex gracilis]
MVHITQILTVFGTLCLIFLTGIASSTDKTLSGNSQCIEPISYEMKIFPLIQNNSFRVESRVKINVTCIQQNIKLYFGRYCDQPEISIKSDIQYLTPLLLQINSVLFYTEDRFKFLNITILPLNINSENIKIHNRIIYFQSGEYWIHAKYNCNLEKVATVFSYVQQSEETQYLILPRIPNEWIFPLWKNPAIKTTFSIRIYHTSDERAFSHMAGDTKIEKNTSCTYFLSTSVMSTHLVAIAVVPSTVANSFNFFEGNIIINRVQMNSKLSYAQSLITNIKHHVSKAWKDVSLSRVIYAAFPINSSHYESVITKNHVFFNEAEITYDEEIDSLAQKKKVTCLVARNVIQEMFTDWLLSLKQSDSWFMESFSAFYGVYIIDQMFGHSLLKSLIVQTRREILDFIEAYTTHNFPGKEISPFISPSSIFIELWRKSALSIFYMVTDMDKYVLYNSMFREAINIHHNTSSSDTYNTQSNFDILWSKLLSDMSTHKNMFFMRTLTTVITSWTHVGYPIVQVNRHNNTRTLEIVIRDCFLSNMEISCVSMWWIPVNYITILQPNVKYHSYLQPDENNIIVPNIEEDDSIIFIDIPGYRVNYDQKSWKNIALFLKTTTFNMFNLSDVTVAQILDDAFYFLIQNTDYNENFHLNSTDNLDIFFDIANSVFHVNNSYIAWYPIFTAFEYLSKIFPFPDSAYIKYRILAVLNKFLEDSSHTPSSENNVTNQLYYEVLKWTCILDGLKCKDIVMAEFKWHVQDPARHKLLPSWQRWMICQSVILENSYSLSDVWITLLHMYKEQSKVEELFNFLPCFRHNTNILLTFFLLPYSFLPLYGYNFNIKESDSITFLYNTFAKHIKSVGSLTSLLHVIESIKETRNISIAAIVTCIINHVYSNEILAKITDENLFQKLMDLHRTPSLIIDAIKKKVITRRNFLVDIRYNFRKKPHDAIYRYLFFQ